MYLPASRRTHPVLRPTLWITVSILLITGLSGCLFNRVTEVRSQFCQFDENFEIRFEHRTRIEMHRPVLLDKDILWLAGVDPTETVRDQDGLRMTWIIEEAVSEPNPELDIRVDLDFDRDGDDYKLSQVLMDPKFSAVMNPEYLNRETMLASAKDICNTGLSFSMRSMEFDISDQELENLPTRPEVLELMGPPHDGIGEDGGWTYRYRLKGNTDERKTAQFTVWFDDVSLVPVRMESQYSRYKTRADFVLKKLSMNVTL